MQTIEVHKGTNKSPIPNAIYVVFISRQKGNSIGSVLRGDECNWLSSEIVGWSLLPVYEQEVIDLFN